MCPCARVPVCPCTAQRRPSDPRKLPLQLATWPTRKHCQRALTAVPHPRQRKKANHATPPQLASKDNTYPRPCQAAQHKAQPCRAEPRRCSWHLICDASPRGLMVSCSHGHARALRLSCSRTLKRMLSCSHALLLSCSHALVLSWTCSRALARVLPWACSRALML